MTTNEAKTTTVTNSSSLFFSFSLEIEEESSETRLTESGHRGGEKDQLSISSWELIDLKLKTHTQVAMSAGNQTKRVRKESGDCVHRFLTISEKDPQDKRNGETKVRLPNRCATNTIQGQMAEFSLQQQIGQGKINKRDLVASCGSATGPVQHVLTTTITTSTTTMLTTAIHTLDSDSGSRRHVRVRKINRIRARAGQVRKKATCV